MRIMQKRILKLEKEENGKEHEDNKEMELETEIDNKESNNNSNKGDKNQSNLMFMTKFE